MYVYPNNKLIGDLSWLISSPEGNQKEFVHRVTIRFLWGLDDFLASAGVIDCG